MARPPVIDADGHIFERQVDIRPYLEAPWQERQTALWPASYPWDINLFGKHLAPNYPDGGSPEQQVEAWLTVMEQENLETAVLFPSSAASVNKLLEPAFATAVARAINTHLATDYGKASDKLRPVGVLPMRDPIAAAEELRRAVTELGMVSFELVTTGQAYGLGDPIYDPIYAEAERLNVPLCIHGSTRTAFEELGADRFRTFNEVHTYSFPASMMLHFTSIMFSGMPMRFPKLKLAFLEIGATWLPYYLNRMDEHWELRGDVEAPWLTKRPSDAFREAPYYVSIEAGETLLGDTLDHIGVKHFLFASDFPHWDAEFPQNLQALEARTDVSEADKRKLLYDNARAFFQV